MAKFSLRDMALNYEIKIKKETENSFGVIIAGSNTTDHKVKVSHDYWKKLTSGKISKEQLIKKSFEFLLEREPNTSILQEFELNKIGYYFPEYEETISGDIADLH